MPSKSASQARLMAAAAHTKGGYDGVPQKVGKEFNQADKGTGVFKKKAEPKKSMKWSPGKTKPISTDRGSFSFKKNRSGE